MRMLPALAGLGACDADAYVGRAVACIEAIDSPMVRQAEGPYLVQVASVMTTKFAQAI